MSKMSSYADIVRGKRAPPPREKLAPDSPGSSLKGSPTLTPASRLRELHEVGSPSKQEQMIIQKRLQANPKPVLKPKPEPKSEKSSPKKSQQKAKQYPAKAPPSSSATLFAPFFSPTASAPSPFSWASIAAGPQSEGQKKAPSSSASSSHNNRNKAGISGSSTMADNPNQASQASSSKMASPNIKPMTDGEVQALLAKNKSQNVGDGSKVDHKGKGKGKVILSPKTSKVDVKGKGKAIDSPVPESAKPDTKGKGKAFSTPKLAKVDIKGKGKAKLAYSPEKDFKMPTRRQGQAADWGNVSTAQTAPDISFNNTALASLGGQASAMDDRIILQPTDLVKLEDLPDPFVHTHNTDSQLQFQRECYINAKTCDPPDQVALLWFHPFEFDIVIESRGWHWYVHRYLLCDSSPDWFGKYIPPGEEGQVVWWNLDSHEPSCLGNVLQFIYLGHYDNKEYFRDTPLDTSSIKKNLAMFMIAAGVEMAEMKDEALNQIEAATDHIADVFKGRTRYERIDKFEENIREALEMMYSEFNQWHIRAVRLVMAKLMAKAFPVITRNFHWESHYQELWGALRCKVVADHKFFVSTGILEPNADILKGFESWNMAIWDYKQGGVLPAPEQPPMPSLAGSSSSLSPPSRGKKSRAIPIVRPDGTIAPRPGGRGRTGGPSTGLVEPAPQPAKGKEKQKKKELSEMDPGVFSFVPPAAAGPSTPQAPADAKKEAASDDEATPRASPKAGPVTPTNKGGSSSSSA